MQTKQHVVTQGVTEAFTSEDIRELFSSGLEKLNISNEEDSPFFKLRVVMKSPRGNVWMIEDGQAVTLLLVDEY